MIHTISSKRSLRSGLVSISFGKSETSGRMKSKFQGQVIAFEQDNPSTSRDFYGLCNFNIRSHNHSYASIRLNELTSELERLDAEKKYSLAA